MKQKEKFLKLFALLFVGVLLSFSSAGWGNDLPSWGRNPFLTEDEETGDKNPPSSGLKVKAIIIGPPRSVATLDGETVYEGEKIGSETVLKIHREGVVLEANGQKRFLRADAPTVSVVLEEKKK